MWFIGDDDPYGGVAEKFEDMSAIADQLDATIESGSFDPSVLESFVEEFGETKEERFSVERFSSNGLDRTEVQEYAEYGLLDPMELGSNFPIYISTDRGNMVSKNSGVIEEIAELYRMARENDAQEIREVRDSLGKGSADCSSDMVNERMADGMNKEVELTKEGEELFEGIQEVDIKSAENYVNASGSVELSPSERIFWIENKSVLDREMLRKEIRGLVQNRMDEDKPHQAVQFFCRYVEVKEENDMSVTDTERNIYTGVYDIIGDSEVTYREEIIEQAAREIGGYLEI